jgi:hypothetical protein
MKVSAPPSQKAPPKGTLGVGADDDVVIAKPEVVPNGGIEMMVVEFPLLLRIDEHKALSQF